MSPQLVLVTDTNIWIDLIGVSLVDLSAYLLAKDLGAILITGDQGLRQIAIQDHLQVHGVLWILDELLRTGIIEYSLACVRLEQIIEKGARLPREDCQKRFIEWGKKTL